MTVSQQSYEMLEEALRVAIQQRDINAREVDRLRDCDHEKKLAELQEQVQCFLEWLSAVVRTGDAFRLMRNADVDLFSKDLSLIHPLLTRLGDILDRDHGSDWQDADHPRMAAGWNKLIGEEN